MSVLFNKTLVLNKAWQPIHITTVRYAVILLYRGAAKAVCPHTYQVYNFDEWLHVPPNGNGVVHSAKMNVPAPDVVVLQEYDRMPSVSSFSKRNVMKRDHGVCQYCGKQHPKMTIDHVMPRSKGGTSDWMNVVLACEPCNKKKADRTPDEAGMHLIRPPYKPKLNISMLIKRHMECNPEWSKFI